jgi:hypothetical protein
MQALRKGTNFWRPTDKLVNSTSTAHRHNPEPHAKKYACLPERGRLHAAAARVKIEHWGCTRIPNFFTTSVTPKNIVPCAITFVYICLTDISFFDRDSSDY